MNPVAKALWYIERHYAEPLSLDLVAEAAGMSRFHLSRMFFAATGRSIASYWRGRRLTVAASALANGAPDILAVALEAGYGSHEAFTRAFHDEFGVTPATLRAVARLDHLNLLEPKKMTIAAFPKLAEPKIETLPSMRLTGLKEFHADPAGIPAQWHRFGPQMSALQPKERVTYGICWMKSSGGEDYMCAGEVADTVDLLPELTVETLPPMTCAVFFHAGHVSAIHETVGAIFANWLPNSGRKPLSNGPTLIERYDCRLNPATGMGGFEILIPLED